MFFWDFYFFLFLIKVCARLLFLDQISGTPFSASNKSDRALFVVSLVNITWKGYLKLFSTYKDNRTGASDVKIVLQVCNLISGSYFHLVGLRPGELE
ncbi:unnamed protein product [Citrullus colocynthis]|uniref:Secreted protein n=1 Tax=Citrullus colocynthis TaxID=252529 RepID=A0ABP0YC82_9ROSI